MAGTMSRSVRHVWLRRLGAAMVIALGLGWLPYQVYGRSGVARMMRLRAELDGLRRENAAMREANARLRAEIQLYDEDEATAIERVARDELGLVKPGELVFKIEETP